MKKLLLIAIISLSAFIANAQKGISYQAVILDPNPIEIPGKDISGQPFVNGSVWVKFVLTSGSVTQFQEVHQTSTDAYGLVNLIIGSVSNSAFNSLTWDANQKTLEVYVSFNQGASYTKVSDQKLYYSPYALYAETSAKLSGILGVSGGGTGATTAVGARANLGLGNVDNTADVDKPVSTAGLAALNLKVDKVAGERLISAAEITKLANQSGVNTGDQDLSSFATTRATNAALALKAPIESPTFTGTVSGITKAMVGLGNADNTADADKPVSTTVQSELDLKAPLDSPVLTGIPLAPTPSAGTNSTQIATTSFVQSAVAANTISIGSISNDPSPNGATISSGILQLTPADISNGGVLTTGQQVFSGQKIFVNNVVANNVSLGMPFTGSQNTMLGEAAFGYAAPGNSNTAIGFMTLASLSNSGGEGNENTAVGTNALRQGNTVNGSRNTAIGVNSMGNASGSYDNVAVGLNTLNAATGGSNTAIGNYSLQNTTTAMENVGVGIMSLYSTTNGGFNTAIGTNSMRGNTSGDVNTAVGYNSLISNSTGRYNTAIGVQAQESNFIGSQNTAIGVAAIDRNTNGSNNVALGSFAGRYIGDGQTYNTDINNSVLIGSETKPLNNSSTNEIVIGYNAIGNGSNTIQLGNANVTNVNTSGALTANASISADITDSFTIDPNNAENYKGKIIICNPSNPITITFSSSLPTGFNCMILQKSADANKITIAGGSGVTIKNRNNYTATAGNYALLTIVHIGSDILVTAGDMQ